MTARDRLGAICLVVFDFDGVFTDNSVMVTEDGKEAVVCSRADGLGLQLLRGAGVECLVLSAETNPVVTARCRKLQIECVQGQSNKWETLDTILGATGVPVSDVAYVGNDLNDLECLARVGVPICVADAHPPVKAACQLVTTRRGGHGAVREICEWILEAKGVSGADVFAATSVPQPTA